MNISIKISKQPLRIQPCIKWVMAPECGGIDVFIGTVRNNTKQNKVIKLEFTAYKKMALKELKKIAEDAIKKWPLQKVIIHHRIGILKIGEIAVIIAVAAAHREAAFKGCKYAIDTLKETVPIWKKEYFADGEVWVAAHP